MLRMEHNNIRKTPKRCPASGHCTSQILQKKSVYANIQSCVQCFVVTSASPGVSACAISFSWSVSFGLD